MQSTSSGSASVDISIGIRFCRQGSTSRPAIGPQGAAPSNPERPCAEGGAPTTSTLEDPPNTEGEAVAREKRETRETREKKGTGEMTGGSQRTATMVLVEPSGRMMSCGGATIAQTGCRSSHAHTPCLRREGNREGSGRDASRSSLTSRQCGATTRGRGRWRQKTGRARCRGG
jgi:hypothetical protein